MDAKLSRRRFLSGSVLFVGGVAVSAGTSACTTDPTGTGGSGSAKITLNHMYHEYGEKGTREAVTRYAREYTKANPDVAVKVTWVPGDYAAKWKSALLAPGGPDVYEINEVSPDMVRAKQVVPLDDIFGSAKSDFDPKVLEPVTYSGKVYGVPMAVDVMLLFYRKSMLSKAGLRPPQSFDELLAAAKKLTGGKRKGLYIGTDAIGNHDLIVPWSSGDGLLDGRKITYNGDATVRALEGVRELYTSKSLLEGYPTDWYEPQAFISGAAAMVWGGMWSLPEIRENIQDDFEVAPWPSFGASGEPVVNLGGWTQVVNGKSKHVEEAKKYVQWLWIKRTDLQKDFNLSYGFHLPPRKSAAASAAPLKSGQAKNAVDAGTRAGFKRPALLTDEARQPLTDAFTDIVKKGADAKKTLDSAAGRSQAVIDKLPKV